MKLYALKSQLLTRRILSRNEVLQPWMVGRSFLVYNGKSYVRVEVVSLRLKAKAGEFVITRKFPKHKKKQRK